ncbi:MAG TPA: methylenetetrahydrofolate--tRNA-(uracil(54)-C(5))-methyltransferase (FADH(2)-oxidizing) TrmFO [Clostridia bacterium]|nr:methylenetetrahydrofolate--tRNA-(uracil(54)-C(5))-methyltransferase (FADH(2)-oxidizing) TrmFO [Clostridia bacterium]
MGKTYENIKIVGGGLAGCEAAYQLLKRGFLVTMFEMRPKTLTGAHKTDGLAELVCSNSLKSIDENTSSGLLKRELEALDCLLLRVAYECKVEAGGALAVDREQFSQAVRSELSKYEKFNLVREEITNLDFDEPAIIATGPLTSKLLADKLAKLSGASNLFFFDAVAPIVSAESVDMNFAFWGGRYGKGGNDYLNLPMTKPQYSEFYEALKTAQCVELKDFEGKEVFEGCMPIEVMAKRGEDAMRYGPLKPVGLSHPLTGERYYAVVQLRKENVLGDALNMVGFQTNLTFPEQKRVFQMIPALHSCEFLRFGVMHRNTYLNSPKILNANFRVKGENVLYIAGQLSGVEGYMESIMSGLLAGIALSRECEGKEAIVPPKDTICGALSNWVQTENANYQPMNANFGLLPLPNIRDKQERKKEFSKRALSAIIEFNNLLNNGKETILE